MRKNKLVLFFLCTVITIFIIPGFAQEQGQGQGQSQEYSSNHIKPYGNLYLFLGGLYSKTYDASQKESDDKDLLYRINNNSNLGFFFTYAKYSGVFDLGIDDIENERKVRIRKAYGEYKLGFGNFLIGQTWSPYVSLSDEAADYYCSKGFGAMYEEPTLQMKFEIAGFYIDIMKPYVPNREITIEQTVNLPTSGGGSTVGYEALTVERDVTTGQPMDYIKTFIPKVALGYDAMSDNKKLRFSAGAGANVYYIDETEDNVVFNKKWIYSYLAYMNGLATISKFSVKVSGGFVVNPANYGIMVQSAGNTTYYGGAAMAIENIATGEWEIKDTWSTQGYLELGYDFTESLLFNMGYGISIVSYPAENTKKDYAMEYYANLKVNLGGLISLTPSFSYRDYMKDMNGNKEGNEIFAGILATVSYY